MFKEMFVNTESFPKIACKKVKNRFSQTISQYCFTYKYTSELFDIIYRKKIQQNLARKRNPKCCH